MVSIWIYKVLENNIHQSSKYQTNYRTLTLYVLRILNSRFQQRKLRKWNHWWWYIGLWKGPNDWIVGNSNAQFAYIYELSMKPDANWICNTWLFFRWPLRSSRLTFNISPYQLLLPSAPLSLSIERYNLHQ